MTYKEALRYLDSFINYEKKSYYDYKRSMKLNRMERFLESLGNPHRDLKTIHITGTKGKGSTAAFVSSILKEAHIKTGLYTSPHLTSFRERIRFNGDQIPENEICGILDEIKPKIENMRKTAPPSFFEVYTALAFLYFKKMKTDLAVLEVGMGGRLDATNAVDSKIAAITPVSFEHTQKLGNTLSQIAFEKSGIIKEGALCISSPQKKEALNVIEDACLKKNATLYLVGRDIITEEGPFTTEGQYFSVWGRFNEYRNLTINLLGQHQIINAAVAVGIVEALRIYNIIIPQDIVQRGLSLAQWPGRLEVAATDPYIILDGAQNVASAEALAAAVERHFNFKRVILLLAMSSDKDVEGVSRVLSKLADEVIITQVQNPRRAKPEIIRKFFNNIKPTTLAKDSKKALDIARSKAKEGDIILAVGSLFLVGELKEMCESLKCKVQSAKPKLKTQNVSR